VCWGTPVSSFEEVALAVDGRYSKEVTAVAPLEASRK